MDLLDKSNIIKNPTKLLKIKEDLLIYNKKRKKKKELSLSNIDNNNEEFDKDKINLENINYLDKVIFNKKTSQTQSTVKPIVSSAPLSCPPPKFWQNFNFFLL